MQPATICVHCGTPAAHLIHRLGRAEYALQACSVCSGFCDPYIESDTLSIFIDLLLAKKPAYRHLLYNKPNESRRKYISKLAFMVMLADLYLTWSNKVLQSPSTYGAPDTTKLLVTQLSNTVLSHVLTIMACKMLQSARSLDRSTKWYTISEALFLSSITRLFFMSLPLIWPERTTSFHVHLPANYLYMGNWTSMDIPTENILLSALEFVNRAVALSAVLGNSFNAVLISLFIPLVTFTTPILRQRNML